jgi:DNA-binding IclR family transcriptional regulator
MKTVRSIERAFEILLAFIDAPKMDISMLQKASDLPRPTLYRLLNTLEKCGLIAFAGEPREYRLTYRALELATSFLSTTDIVSSSGPILHDLWRETGETVCLFAAETNDRRVLLREYVSQQPLAFTYGAGHIAHVTQGAAGKIMLANWSQDAIDRVLNHMESNAERVRIRADIANARSQGFYLSKGEVNLGAASIAAPVFDRTGQVAGSIAVTGPESRITGKELSRITKQLLIAARRISLAMGHQPAVIDPETPAGRSSIAPAVQ